MKYLIGILSVVGLITIGLILTPFAIDGAKFAKKEYWNAADGNDFEKVRLPETAERLPIEHTPVPMNPDSSTAQSDPELEERREDAGGCVVNVFYDSSRVGQEMVARFGERYRCGWADENDTSKCVDFPYKTQTRISVAGPGFCYNTVSIFEGELSQGARVSINGLFYDTDSSAAQLVAPFVEAVRTQTKMMVFVKTEGPQDRNILRIANLFDNPGHCPKYYNREFIVSTQACVTGYDKTHEDEEPPED